MPITISGTSRITQANLGANAAGNGPCFSAFQSTPQSVPSSTFTKVVLQSVDAQFPSVGFTVGATAVDSLSGFQPSVAGVYQIEGCVYLDVVFSADDGGDVEIVTICKNGSEYKRGIHAPISGGSGVCKTVSAPVYLNGVSDYVELFTQQGSGTSVDTVAGAPLTYFQGFLARAT